MNSPFVFNRPLTPTEMLGRNAESNWLSGNLVKGQHSLVWDHPRTGKTTLINHALDRVRKSANQTVTCTLNCYNFVSFHSMLASMANALFHTLAGSTYGDWCQLVNRTLPVCHPEVSVQHLQEQENLQLSFPNALTREAEEELLMFPEQITAATGKKLILVFESFHHVLSVAPAGELTRLAKAWRQHTGVTYLLCGCGTCASSQTSAYSLLFGPKKPFFKFAEQIVPERIDEKEFADHIVRNFSKAGRVISKDFAERIYRNMDGHPFYTQQFADICFSNTQGYMNEPMFINGMKEMLDQHQSTFERICGDLSLPQIHFLHALAQGVEQFSAAGTLTAYHLNSSANVFRVRDALEHKEIIEIRRKKPCFIDPLFKLWFTERFCLTYWI